MVTHCLLFWHTTTYSSTPAMPKQPNEVVFSSSFFHRLYMWTISVLNHSVSSQKEAHTPKGKNVLLVAWRVKSVPRLGEFWLADLCPTAAAEHPTLLSSSPSTQPYGSTPPAKAWLEAASHLLFFSRSLFSWAHESFCDIFKDLPGARDQRLGTFFACELVPAFS